LIRDPRYPKPEALLRIPEYGHAIVEASAGTGKTHTIEHLFVDLVLAQGLRVGEILAVTFTEKAASELERRVREKLEELLALRETTTRLSVDQCWVLSPEARERLEGALNDFDSASIGTIHAFCNQVLEANPFLSGSLFEREHVDERRLFSEVFTEQLRHSFTRDRTLEPFLTAWLETRRSTVDQLEDLLYRAARLRAPLGPRLDVEAIARAVARFPDLEEIERKLPELVNRSSLAKTRRNLLGLKAALEAPNVAGLIAELEGVELSYLGDRLPSLLAPATTLERTAVPLAAAVVERFLPPLLERLKRHKRETGRYDYQDMLTSMAEVLDGPSGPELIRLLQARFRAVLIDEFQDTDETQWRIFKRVFFDTAGHHPLRLVGDPKQSIYAFRGADVHVYLRAKKTLVTRSTVVPLVESFRATPEMVEALNEIFDQKAEHPFFDGSVKYERPLRAGRTDLSLAASDGAPAPPVVLLRAEGDDARRALALGIADEIRAILGEGDRRLSFGERGKERPVRASEVFVLTRTHREAEEVASALDARGVAHAFYKKEGLFQSREAEEVRDLLAALEARDDRTKLARAWMTSFFGMTLGELEGDAHDVPGDHPLMRRLAEWRLLADERSYEALFTRLLEDSGVLRRALFASDGERKIENLVQILDTLLEDAYRRRPTTRELASAVESYIEGRGLPAGSEKNVMRYEGGEAVRIMTIHMAKGLEASVVFLYAFSGSPPSNVHAYHVKDQRRGFVGDARRAPADVRGALEQEYREENQRLVYVALTRARARLYLPLVPDVLAKRGCYGELHDRLQDLVGIFRVQPVPSVTAWGEPRDVDLSSWRPPEELLEENDGKAVFDALKERHQGLVITSYTRMKSRRGGYRAPIEDRADVDGAESIGSPRSSLPGGRATGSCLHEILESISMETFEESPSLESWRGREDVKRAISRAMRRNGVDRRFRPEAERLVHAALTSPVELGETRIERGFRSVSRLVREVEFVYPYPSAGPGSGANASSVSEAPEPGPQRGFVKGFVDLVFEHEGLVYLCDWKSDDVPDWSEPGLRRQVERNYRLQAKLYGLAVVKMLGVEKDADYRARFGGIVFCFLRGMPRNGIYFERPSFDMVQTWYEELSKEKRL
jgi:exodeoxyribonuclease V beta subunit